MCIYAGGIVAASSKKQTSIAKSTTAAELFACDHSVDLCLWILDILTVLGTSVSLPIPVHQDNQSVIALIKGGTIGKEHRATRAKIHYIREKISEGLIQLIHVRTELMLADLLTKVVQPKHLRQDLIKKIISDCSEA